MNPSCPPASVARRIATLAFLAIPVISASAATIVQTANDTSNNNWNLDTIWGGATPTSGNDYVTAAGLGSSGATFLGSPNVTGRVRDVGGNPFAGASLTISPNTELLLKNQATTSTANIILNGGVLRFAPDGGNSATLAGNLNVAAESYLGSNITVAATFTVASALTGNSILHVAAGSGGSTNNLSSTISFTGDLSGFTGTFNLGGGTRTGGGKDATLDFGQDYVLPNVTLRMGEFASFDFLNLDQNLTFGSFSFASTALAAGTYSAANLNTLFGNGSQFIDLAGTHTLTVVPEPSAAALLAGAGCGLVVFGRRRRR